jgi:3-hydroxyacyl-[acyl-carrier-protein] dehydratase
VGSDDNSFNADSGSHRQPLFIGAEHPALPGHFPGTPVVPGVLLLDQVLNAADQWLGEAVQPLRLRQAKFPAPWLPGMQVLARLERRAQVLRFEVTANDQTLALGVFELQAGSDRQERG